MTKGKFLLVSLDDSASKELAEVLANSTSKKIISYLSDHEDATETQLSKELDIPLSTVHYNLQKLKKAKLVSVEEFHYSKKAKEVDHYKLANQYVIITPKPVKGIRSKLKSILPVGLIILGIGTVIEFMTSFTPRAGIFAQRSALQETVPLAQEAADVAAQSAPVVAEQISAPLRSNPHWGILFIIGGLVALGLYALVVYVRSRKKN